jgi:hypothetical protein
MTFIKNLWLQVIAFFRTAWGQSVLAAGEQVVKSLGRKYADLLIKEAQERALELEKKYPAGSGDLKHKELVDYLRLRSTDLGLSLGQSVLNLVVEVAVSALKQLGRI